MQGIREKRSSPGHCLGTHSRGDKVVRPAVIMRYFFFVQPNRKLARASHSDRHKGERNGAEGFHHGLLVRTGAEVIGKVHVQQRRTERLSMRINGQGSRHAAAKRLGHDEVQGPMPGNSYRVTSPLTMPPNNCLTRSVVTYVQSMS